MPKGKGTYGRKRGRPSKKGIRGANKQQFTKWGAKKRTV